MVNLYKTGKPSNEIVREYKLTASTFHKWVKYYNASGSFKEKDNRSEEEKRLLELEKENKQLKMENDISYKNTQNHGIAWFSKRLYSKTV